jgi:hypothetical protein
MKHIRERERERERERGRIISVHVRPKEVPILEINMNE